MNFETYRLILQAQKYNGHSSEKIAKWVKCIDDQKKSAVFKPSDPISVLTFLDIFKFACESNEIYEESATQIFPI